MVPVADLEEPLPGGPGHARQCAIAARFERRS
jgi:hypothetical protein